MKEIYKDVVGWEGFYLVSNLGKIKSVNYNRSKRTKAMKLCVAKNRGDYLVTILVKGERKQNVRIHREVAKAFIPNPLNKPEANIS